jgi:N-acetylmuramoyl-L-alanine amidase
MRPDGLLLLTLLSAPSLADAEDEAQSAVLPLDETQSTTGPAPRVLEGMTVVLSPGHGKHMHISIDGHTELTWDFQRKRRHGMREDTWTAAFVTDHLAPALEARGATVLSLRARDRHHEVVFADDADTTFELTEGWPVPNQDAWGNAHHVVLPGGTARWILTAPADGRWFVATRWTSDPALQASATYRLASKTATTTTQVDQTLHGGVWWPLGYADLRAGETLEVTLDAGDQPALADAVRMGGGTFTGRDPHTQRADVVSRFDLAAVHQLEYLGGPESLLTEDDGSILSDMRFRPRWASWAFEGDDDAIFLSIHTNAGRGHGSTIYVGHDTDVSPPAPVRPASRAMAEAVSRQVGTQLKEACPTWRHRGVWTGNLSEISPHWNALEGILVELGFHDSRHDTKWLVDPEFQEAAANAIADGLVSWRLTQDAPAAPGAPVPAID